MKYKILNSNKCHKTDILYVLNDFPVYRNLYQKKCYQFLCKLIRLRISVVSTKHIINGIIYGALQIYPKDVKYLKPIKR